MQSIILDFTGVQVERRDGGRQLWDPIRQKAVKADPEEEVRQYLIAYLLQNRSYPRSLISVERALKVGELTKRYDIVVYDREVQPRMLVECKSPSTRINQQVFDQAGRYNLTLQVPWLVVSNGGDTFCARIDFQRQTFQFQPQLPDFHQLCTF